MPSATKSHTLAALAAVIVAVVLWPAAMIGVILLAATGDTGSCGDGGGPGGGSQQVGGRAFTAEQISNARTITAVAESRRLPQRAAVISLATGIVESNLSNLDHGDRDSLGIFQQRPSQGWGSPEQILNPAYATGTFLDHLQRIPGWLTLPAGVAEQQVQRSAFPDRYSPAEPVAAALMTQFWTGPDNPPPAGGPGDPALVAHAAATGCADQGGANTPLDPQSLPADYRLPTDPPQRAAVEFALAQRGKPYVWGAKGPDAFDCSGLTHAAWAAAGVGLSAGTAGQVHDGTPVAALDAIQPGDLLFIPGSDGTPAHPGHVGLYAGGGLIVDAYDPHRGVIVERLTAWQAAVVAIRHIPAPARSPG